MTNKQIEDLVAEALQEWVAPGNKTPLDRLLIKRIKEQDKS